MNTFKRLLMLFGWRCKGQHRPTEGTLTYTARRDKTATARTALADLVAMHHLQVARERSAEVTDLAKTMQGIRERNHFGETVRRAVR